jgi:hypothetical protein
MMGDAQAHAADYAIDPARAWDGTVRTRRQVVSWRREIRHCGGCLAAASPSMLVVIAL